MIADPLFYAAAIPAVILVGMAKGGFGGPLALLGVPLMALVIPPVQAAGILLPILVAMDLTGIWAYRRVWDVELLRILLPAAMIGIAIGWLTASWVTDAHVRLIVGIVALLFTLDYWFALRERYEKRQAGAANGLKPETGASGTRNSRAARRDRWSGRFWAAISGFTSFVSHAGGPPLAVYMLPKRLDRQIYAGTSVIYFTVVNQAKLVPYFFLDQFRIENLSTSAALLPLAPLATLGGVWLVRRVDQTLFYRFTYAAVFLISLKLIWDGLSGLGAELQ